MKLYIDQREQISKQYFDEHFREVNLTTLSVGDVYAKPYLIEIKIGQDVHDYHRLQEELSRMCEYKAKHTETELHLCYCNTTSYVMPIVEMKRVVHWSQMHGVMFHHDWHVDAMMATIKSIFRGDNAHKLIGRAKHKHLSDWENMLCVRDGITPEKAQAIAKIWSIPADFATNPEVILNDVFNIVFGVKKNGDEKKITMDFLNFWFGGENNTTT